MKNLSTRGYSFQTSLLFELLRHGARVLEIPITFPDRTHGTSKLTFQDQFEFMVNIVKLRFGKYYEFLKYIFIGFTGTLVNLGIYTLLTRITDWKIEPAAIVAIEISILFNFVLNNLWRIRSKKGPGDLAGRLFNYHKLSSAGALINFIVLIILVYKFAVFDILANFIGIILGVIINYPINAFFSWQTVKGRKNSEN